MIRSIIQQPNPKLDLLFERIVDVSRENIWTAWTIPEQLKKWFTPEPCKTVDCEIDLRPGGILRRARNTKRWDFVRVGEKPLINSSKLSRKREHTGD